MSTPSTGHDTSAKVMVDDEDKDQNGIGAVTTHTEDDDQLGAPVEFEQAAAKKKKKKKSKSRSKSKRGLNAPDGFEEFFADAPITPEQHAEDQETYHSALPLIDRILAAIQRFERTRKLSPERRHIFYDYLAYGGVDVSPNMFQSASDLDQKSMTKDELASALSQVSIGSEKYDLCSPKALYAVDFLGCMQAYLSRHASSLYGSETFDKVLLITTTLERFMDYLLQHDVCPEYKSDILKTRDLCRAASSELWGCSQAQLWLPGDFNIASSTLFGGFYAENYGRGDEWRDDDDSQPAFVGMSSELASQVVRMGIAGAASEAVYQRYMNILNCQDGSQEFEVIDTKPDVGFTITKIFQPTKDCIKLYKTRSADLRPVGRIVAEPWTNPDRPPEDLTPAEREALTPTISSIPKYSKRSSRLTEIKDGVDEYIFLIETPLITHLHVGMHIEATIHRLNFGIWWFDHYTVVYPSFDNYLCNDLMVGWKEPRWLKGSVEYEKQEERDREEEERARKEEEERSPRVEVEVEEVGVVREVEESTHKDEHDDDDHVY